MKKVILWKLKILTKLLIKKYKPQIIGITGSVGKTSTKEAIFSVLKQKFNCRRNIKSYNNQIGVPLTVIGMESGGRSMIKWMQIFFKAINILLVKDKNYPQILILEMGADRNGDIDYLIGITPPLIGIITAISPVHLENFGSLENIAKEKFKIFKNIPSNGLAIINLDETSSMSNFEKLKSNRVTVGVNNKSTIMGSDINIMKISPTNLLTYGTNFKMNYQGSSVPVFLPGVLGIQHVYPALVAADCGIYYGINMIEISSGLKEYNPPPGRMKTLAGIKNTLIIDDSFNSSPRALNAALEVLGNIKEEGAKKYAILGDMLELGNEAKKIHYETGKKAASIRLDCLITVGDESLEIARGAKDGGMEAENIFSFKNSIDAGRKAQELIRQGDIILIKGSQKMRMENTVKELMASPLDAEKLLVRQDREWKKKN